MPFEHNKELGDQRSQALNEMFNPNMISEIQDDFGVKKIPIYVYNVGPLEHNSPRPPNHPHMLLRKCPPDQPYLMVGQISHPFAETEVDTQNGEKKIRWTDGYREATRMLNPMNPGTDQNFNDPSGFHYGENLNALGCFWSQYAPGDDRLMPEIEAAVKRMEAAFTKELEDMVAVEAEEGKDGARARRNRISMAASNYFKQSFSWNRLDLTGPKADAAGKHECPNCGELVKIGVPYHALGGTVCVWPDADAWARAVNAGVKKAEDIPEVYRARAEEPALEDMSATQLAEYGNAEHELDLKPQMGKVKLLAAIREAEEKKAELQTV